jgi:hypothetical protein
MALTKDEVENIRNGPMLSPGLRNADRGKKIISDMINPDLAPFRFQSEKKPNSFRQDCFARVTDALPGNCSITLSTSVYPEVASSVGWHSSGRTEDENASPYLFQLQIPRIMTYCEEDMMEGDYRGPDGVKIGEKIFSRRNVLRRPTGLEVFVPFAILKDWIVDVRKIAISKPWKRC